MTMMTAMSPVNLWNRLTSSLSRVDSRPLPDVLRQQLPSDVIVPPFFEGSYEQAVREARTNFRFLMVYLHAPEHPASGPFVEKVLCTSGFVQAVVQDFILWGSSVASPAGYERSIAFGVSTFPFLAVISPLRTSEILAKWEGAITLSWLLGPRGRLAALLDAHRTSVVAAQATHLDLTESRQLRERQERAYEEAARIDREALAAERERAEREQAAARAEALAAEAAARAAREAEDLERNRQRSIERDRSAAAAEVASWPQPPETGAVCKLRVSLPDGSTVDRSFLPEQRVADLLTFARASASWNGERLVATMLAPAQPLGP